VRAAWLGVRPGPLGRAADSRVRADLPREPRRRLTGQNTARLKGMEVVKRILEPELMEDEVQALAYVRADFADSNSNFVRHFTELAGRDFAGALLDLGCGPEDTPLRLARVYPHMIVHELDGSAAMLRRAREAAALAPEAAARVEWVQGLVPGAALPAHAMTRS
jgi:hypothetical protein